MFISFIIPAYNEQSLIGATVQAIRSAVGQVGEQIASHEIIVVNDASTDRTAEIAREHGAIVIDVEKRQIAAVRNAGAMVAKGDVFIFVDADTLISAPTLRGAIAALNSGAIGGGAVVRFDAAISWPVRFLAWALMRGFVMFRIAAGCFVYCTREAFEAVGGFDEKFFASEEIWISKALKRQGRFVMVRAPVITSGRKVRMHGHLGLLWQSVCIGLRGTRGVQKREGLELWYDGRRE